MASSVDASEQLWFFQFAYVEWLLVPVVLMFLFLLNHYFSIVALRWRMPGYMEAVSHHYFHARFKLIRKLVDQKVEQTRQHSRSVQTIVLWLVIFLCCLALAQPQWIRKQLQKPHKYRDIVFIVDASVSMSQRDYILEGKRIDRMTLLKGMLSRFIDQLQGDNVSIVVYADSTYTLLPLTRDHVLAKKMLSRIEVGVAGRTSAMGNALTQAVQEAQKSTNSDRVLVLLTDGTRLTGEIHSDVAMEMARQAGLHIYTVAIGARTTDASEKKVSGLIYDPADTDRLKKIAEHTGGRFYWAGDARALSEAIYDIEQTESKTEKPRLLSIKKPLYQWPLLVAVLLFTWLQLNSLHKRGVV